MFLKVKAYYFLIGLICLSGFTLFAQDQRVADSLAVLYKQDIMQGKQKLELLKNLAFNELNSSDKSLQYADELIVLAQNEKEYKYVYSGYLQKGDALLQRGDLELALEAFLNCVEAAKEAKYKAGQGTGYMSIADTYTIIENFENAEINYIKAINLLRETEDSIALASALLNAGDSYLSSNKYQKAITHFEESGKIFQMQNYDAGIAYNKGNLGMAFAKLNKDELALTNINEAVAILEELQDFYPIAVYLTYMADIYAEKNDFYTAVNYTHRSLELATQYGLKDQISDANLKLSELYEKLGNYSESLTYYKDYKKYRDSIVNIKNVQELANLEVNQKQAQVELLEQKRKNQRFLVYTTLLALLSIVIFTTGLYRRHKFIKATNVIIEAEKQRSDNLLLNILPEETAQELKEKGSVEAKRFDSVTVLFTDFKGFSNYAKHLTPEELVQSVDFYFSKFDNIMEKYGLEKIKTVGDAYMCAGGLPFPTEDHASKMIFAAMEIAEFVNTEKQKHPESNTHFDIRIGINTGPVVAGVVGSKKFAYDIWGDAVNIASRMESGSEAGRINISEYTYELVKDQFDCEYRGKIEVKNRGKLNMYFVNGTKNVVA